MTTTAGLKLRATWRRTRGRAAPAIVLLALALSPPASLGGAEQAAAPSRIALVGGMLIDGHAAPPIHHAAILIEGDTIVEVGRAADLEIPPDYAIVDTRGRTMMPGLIDLHAHLLILGHGNYGDWFPWIDARGRDGMLPRVMEISAKQLLRAGVTSAVDLGAPLEASLEVRDRIERGEIPGPRMSMSGPWITRSRGRMNTQFGGLTITSPDQAIESVERLVAAGVDVIKAHSGLTAADYQAIADTAHAHGVRVHAHVYAERDVRHALEAGIDVLTHAGSAGTAPPYSDALITDIVAAGRPVVVTAAHRSWIYPDTAAFPERLQDPRLEQDFPPAIYREVQASLANWRGLGYFARTDREIFFRERGLKQFIESGAVMGMGTDSGTPMNFHTEALWREAKAHVDMGMSPQRVLSALTRINASILGKSAELGTIEAGKLADIIVLEGDPFFDITALARVETVVKGGRVVKGTTPQPAGATAAADDPRAEAGEWAFYGGDQAATKYSALDDIDLETVDRLDVAWEWQPGERQLEAYGTRPGNFQNTPLMIDGVLYVSTPYNRVVALDAETGVERWAFDPRAYADGQPPNGQGFVHRGVAAWRDGDRLRIFLNTRHRLISLDAATGEPVDSFGTGGVVDLSQGLIWPINRRHYTNTSPPVVYQDLVIVGNGVGDRLMYRNDPPGDVRAFDARTGAQVWSFHTIPQEGELGNDTWEDDSWRFTGHTNVWAPMSLDVERGLLYLPVGTPSNDYYGGRRKGDNLFAESLVCLDAATGERRWHYQLVHHGLWDYDLPAAPNLVTITVDGRRIDAVAQVTKMGFVFVFDRVTGTPVWPIDERPVPQSDVPGERTSPTQPFPTRPPPFADQGVTLDDAFDLTPELERAARAELRKYRLGGLYTPPSIQGTVVRPGVWGGANWGGGAFDPRSGRLFVKTVSSVLIARIAPFDRASATPQRRAEVDADYVNRRAPTALDGVPLLKPPYAHLAAIDLNAGEIAWRVPFGDNPGLRQILERKGVRPPDQLGASGPAGAIVTAGGLVFIGGGDLALHAIDSQTGRDVWTKPLAQPVTGTPMTYRTRSGRQFVVVATGGGQSAALVAFALGPVGRGAARSERP